MVIHPCAKYGKPMSNHKKVMGRTQKHVKNPINLTLRSKFKVISGSWMYATHRLMVIHPCVKYGKPMSNHKKVMGRTRIFTDGRTDRQSDFYIPPWTSFSGGIKKRKILLLICIESSDGDFFCYILTNRGSDTKHLEKKTNFQGSFSTTIPYKCTNLFAQIVSRACV